MSVMSPGAFNHFLPFHISDSMKHVRISAQFTIEKEKRSYTHVDLQLLVGSMSVDKNIFVM